MKEEADKERERSAERVQGSPRQYSLYFHEYHKVRSSRNIHDPSIQGMTTSGSYANLASNSSKMLSIAGSNSQLPTIANTSSADIQQRETFVPYIQERDNLNVLLGSYKPTYKATENLAEAAKFDYRKLKNKLLMGPIEQ